MDNTVIVVIISSLATIFTTIWTARNSDAVQGEQIKTIREDLTKLTNKVEAHNNYGLEIVAIKERVTALEKRS